MQSRFLLLAIVGSQEFMAAASAKQTGKFCDMKPRSPLCEEFRIERPEVATENCLSEMVHLISL